ncbi:proteasome regulatory particle base subunit [Nowakowskiella sp. JEL0407]|nr:proteasome regulatory particle base subunit [Nowakowskiella sp. JEL0407]
MKIQDFLLVFVFISVGFASSLSVSDVEIRHLDAQSTGKFSQKISHPTKLSTNLDILSTDVLKVSLKAPLVDDSPVLLNNALLSFEGPGQYTAILELDDNKYTATIELKIKSVQEAFDFKSGKYDINLYLYAKTAKPLVYNIGKASISLPTLDDIRKAAGKQPKIAGVDEYFELRPEITHTFAPSEKLPPKIISAFFALLVLVPWVGFVGGLGYLKANFNGLFSANGNVVYGSSFIGVLSAWVVLFYLYFTIFNMFQLLAFGFPLSLVTLFVGRQALIVKAEERIKEEKSERK